MDGAPWQVAAGWLASTAQLCREMRLVTIPVRKEGVRAGEDRMLIGTTNLLEPVHLPPRQAPILQSPKARECALILMKGRSGCALDDRNAIQKTYRRPRG